MKHVAHAQIEYKAKAIVAMLEFLNEVDPDWDNATEKNGYQDLHYELKSNIDHLYKLLKKYANDHLPFTI